MKRLPAAMLLLVLTLVFTIGVSLAYDGAVNETQTIRNGILVNRVQANAVAASAQTTITFTSNEENATTSRMYFENKWWEPGYVDAGLIKIHTNSDIAYTITLSKVSDADTLSELAKVIDVYCIPGDMTGRSRSEVTDAQYRKGTLWDFLEEDEDITGAMQNSQDVQYITLALKMRETAGNSYQNLSVCKNGIQVKVTVTQTT